MNRIVALLSLALMLLVMGCQSHEPAPPPLKHYHLQGEIVAVDVPKRMLTVKHGDIPGFMDAMTMPYQAAETEPIDKLQVGDKITADLVVGENVEHLEKIVVVEKAVAQPPPAPPPSQLH